MNIHISKYPLIAFFTLLSLFQLNAAVPQKLTCNYRVNPVGIGNTAPNLSWQIATTENNWLQSAYSALFSVF
jgi:alpha-L-rhamnosidase